MLKTSTAEDKKRKLVESLELERYTGSDVAPYIRSENNKLWMKLISSDWFSYFLQYLNLKDIANLDTAFCNHEDRMHWFILLKSYCIPNLDIEELESGNALVKWLTIRKVGVKLLKLTFNSQAYFSNQYPMISDEAIIALICNSQYLHTLELDGGYRVREKNLLFSHNFNCYSSLKVLKVDYIEITKNGFKLLSKTCHQLKVIELKHTRIRGIEKLLMTNRNLLKLNVTDECDRNGNILEVLGQYCPLLQSCSLSYTKIIKYITKTQIETFTKGCQYLKSLCLYLRTAFLVETATVTMFDTLLLNLGTYNPLLEELELSSVYSNIKMCTMETMKHFSMGCLLLRKIMFMNMNLSTSVCITHLINNCTLLEKISLDNCQICDDGIIITKANNKLQNLKSLDLSFNGKLTDESFINIINGCNILEGINFCACDKLTDASLISIAANCPNLKRLNFDQYKSFTKIGLNELKTKCLLLELSNK